MNDLYTQDRMARNDSDFGGSGVGAGHYTPQEEFKEKISELKLPLILLAFTVLCAAVIIFLTVKEVSLYQNGTAVEGTIVTDRASAKFTDPNGNIQSASIGWAHITDEDTTITLYYSGNDYAHAQPITSIYTYVIAYLCFGVMLAGVIFWMYKILHRTKHAEKASVEASGYRSKFDE